jgi:hypothetical protein
MTVQISRINHWSRRVFAPTFKFRRLVSTTNWSRRVFAPTFKTGRLVSINKTNDCAVRHVEFPCAR